MSDADVTLYISKLFDKPLRVLKYKVQRMLGHTEPIPVLDQMKLMIYQGHDHQQGRMLSWMKPTNIAKLKPLPFAT